MTERKSLFALVFIFAYIFLASAFLFKKNPIQTESCISAEEYKLYNLINEYRKKNKLPAIPLSKSLSYVAREHVTDLQLNHPDKGRCNMHSWSAKGKWTGCCYTDDHKKASCMWNKPSELTSYKSNGYEIACSGVSTAEKALEGWKGSLGHNGVILNKAPWKNMTWNAMGVGMNGEYAVVWFGAISDPEGKPEICK
ncbi:MAG: CAP domain-containing protein [Cytophagaceae bacterium]